MLGFTRSRHKEKLEKDPSMLVKGSRGTLGPTTQGYSWSVSNATLS